MRHRTKKLKLGTDRDHTNMMVRNLVTSLVMHGRIKTTKKRARAAQKFTEKAITIAKTSPELQAIRLLGSYITTEAASKKLLKQLKERYADVPSGYTRRIKIGRRTGDDSELIMVELIEGKAETTEKTSVKKEEKKSEESTKTIKA